MTTFNLEGSVFLITGAAGQLGQALTNFALENGALVVAADTDMLRLDEAASQNAWETDRVLLQEVDIRSESNVQGVFQAALARFGQVDGVINNAGVSVFEPWKDRTEEMFDWVTHVNLKGTFFCMKSYFTHLAETKTAGAVVNIASHYGIISPDPRIYTDCDRRNSEVYGATKAGVIQMTKYFAANAPIDGVNVRVNAVAPGGIRNPVTPQGDEFQALYADRCPMGRMAEAEEMVAPVFFLMSPHASYVNGHTLVVDGGMSVW